MDNPTIKLRTHLDRVLRQWRLTIVLQGLAIVAAVAVLLAGLSMGLDYVIELDSLARGTLGMAKAADGLQAVQWFRAGQVDKVLDYCRQDVIVTRGLYEYGHARKHLRYYDRYRRLKQVPVQW